MYVCLGVYVRVRNNVQMQCHEHGAVMTNHSTLPMHSKLLNICLLVNLNFETKNSIYACVKGIVEVAVHHFTSLFSHIFLRILLPKQGSEDGD